jgi:transposase
VLAYVEVHGVAPAAQRFGLDRKTVRTWRDRYRAHGESGLVPRYPTRRPRRIPAETVALIAHARTEFRYGACRTRLWLIRVHERRVATKTITRICEDLGLPPLQRLKRRRQAVRDWEQVYNYLRFRWPSTAGRPPKSSPPFSRPPEPCRPSFRSLSMTFTRVPLLTTHYRYRQIGTSYPQPERGSDPRNSPTLHPKSQPAAPRFTWQGPDGSPAG